MSANNVITCAYVVHNSQVEFLGSSTNQNPTDMVKAKAEESFTSFIHELFESMTATDGLTLKALEGKTIEIQLKSDDPSTTSHKISMAVVGQNGRKTVFFLNETGERDEKRSVSAVWVRVLSGAPSKPAPATTAAALAAPKALPPAVPPQKAVEHEECQCIDVSDATHGIMSAGVATNKKILGKLIKNPSSLMDYLANHQTLIEYNDAMILLRHKMKLTLMERDRATMLPKLKKQLISAGHAASEVDRYLSDEQSLADRLFFHSELADSGAEFSTSSQSTLEHIAQLETRISDKIRKEYKPVGNRGGGHCFFYSCAHLTADKSQSTWLSSIVSVLSSDSSAAQKSWRDKVADHLVANRHKYEPLVTSRMETDGSVPKRISYEKYCEWIRRDGSWGGQPELEAFSEITQRPVIVLQNVYGKTPRWSAGINLHFAGEPLVFMNYSASHFEAMIGK